jgi:hypothetical protein
MASDPGAFYPVVAQIAATFAGFGSLASGLGQRRAGDDARMDAFRLSMMLFATLSATLAGLLPVTIMGLGAAPSAALRISAALAAVAVAINAPRSTRHILRIRHVGGFNLTAGLGNTVCTLTALVAFAACATDLGRDRGAGVYLLGLVALLGSSMIMFSRVIVSLLRPHSEAQIEPSD